MERDKFLRDFKNSVFGFAERNTTKSVLAFVLFIYTLGDCFIDIAVSYVNQIVRQHLKCGKHVKQDHLDLITAFSFLSTTVATVVFLYKEI